MFRIVEGSQAFAPASAAAIDADASAAALVVHDSVVRQLEHVAAYVLRTSRMHRFTVYAVEPGDVQIEAIVEPNGSDAARVTFRRAESDWKELRETHLLRAAIDEIQDVVLVTEAEPFPPRIVFANKAFTRMTQYEVDEVIGKSPKILQGPRTDAATQAFIGARLRAWQSVRAEVLNYRKDGSEFWAELDISPVADESGWFTHWIAVQREVTERRHREQERLVASRMELFSLLAPGVAHDFGNVLANILATTGQLDRELRRGAAIPPERLLEATKTIGDAVRHGRALTKQLLSTSRGKPDVITDFQLSTIVEEMTALGRAGSAMVAVIDADPTVRARGSADALRQIVLNLVVNARAAMPEGGQLRVALTAFELGDGDPSGLPAGPYARLVVRDEGVGIAPENLRRIFDPHFTTKSEGTGLGLAVVNLLVKRLGGAISVESELGAFTEFTVLLPLAAAPANGVSPQVPATLPPAAALRSRPPPGMRVLVVDDDPGMRSSVAQLLVDLGCTYELVGNARDAISAYVRSRMQGQAFTCVVLDLFLPGGVGGAEIAEGLHALDPELPIIVLTANPDALPPAEAATVRAVLPKPFDPDALASLLASLGPG